ncbi:hypothetical protein MRX96_037058 [Rhipicephalus microplus]
MNQGPPDGATDLQEAKTCAELMIQRRIFSESKDEVAVVICGSERTNNSLSSDDEYQNIDVLCGLQPVSFDMLEKLVEVEATKHVCDFVDAIVVALDLIVDKTKNLKFSSRRVVLLSNLGGTFKDSQQSIIAEGMKNSDLSLTIVSPFDVQNIGDDLGKLSAGQQKAVKYVGRILEAVNGDSYTFSQAMPALMSYEKKRTRPTPWNANLEIGPDISIPISSYIKVVEVKPKSWKQCVAKRPAAPVRCDTVYYRNDEKESEVEKDGTIVAYRYGSTLVPFTDEYRAAMEGSKGRFWPGSPDQKRHYYMGDKTSYVAARKGDESAGAALSALIQALKKSKMVAIVRNATSASCSFNCLTWKTCEDSRFCPWTLTRTISQLTCSCPCLMISSLRMDLTAVDIDGEPEELFKSSQTSNPYLQRLYQCIQHRAMHPKDPLPPTPQYIADAIKTPKAVLELAEPVLKKIAAAFPLEEVAPVKVPQDNGVGPSDQSKDHVSNSDEPASKRARTDVSMADLVATATTKVDVVNPVEDFKKLVSGKDHSYSDVCEQLEGVILKLFKDALGRAAHGKAVQCLRAYRESALEKSNPNIKRSCASNCKEGMQSKHMARW